MGTTCKRQSSYFWQCLPCTRPAALFSQCGGKGACPPDRTCADAEWPESCCPAGSSCLRQHEWFWQCLPVLAPPPKSKEPPVLQEPPAMVESLR
jgi:hypothetical protein